MRPLCRLGLHRWTPPRGDGYARSTCRRCGEPWAKRDLAAELERERQQHHDDVFTLITGAGLRAIQFGNVERVWPEQLDQFRELAREGGHQVVVVSGAGKCHGVYWVWP